MKNQLALGVWPDQGVKDIRNPFRVGSFQVSNYDRATVGRNHESPLAYRLLCVDVLDAVQRIRSLIRMKQAPPDDDSTGSDDVTLLRSPDCVQTEGANNGDERSQLHYRSHLD
jgi:hypothetical protein